MKTLHFISIILVCILLISCGKDKRPHANRIILIVIDTLRADELEIYGGSPAITPNMNKFAGEGTVFTNAWAQSSWTMPSMATILTGLYPNEHGAYKIEKDITPVRDDVDTIAEKLKSSGFITAAWYNNHFGEKQYGLTQGFDHFSLAVGHYNTDIRDASETTSLVIDWINKHGNENFFIFLHYYDPHLKYEAPLSNRKKFVTDPDYSGPLNVKFGVDEELFDLRSGIKRVSKDDRKHFRELYDGEANYVDEQIGKLITYLETQSWNSSLLTILTSDHGEEFWDHIGVEHGHTYYNELIHIPLIIKYPAGYGQSTISDLPVGQIDIAPTILDSLDIDVPKNISGHSLWGVPVNKSKINPDRPIVSGWPLYAVHKIAYIESGYKLITHFTDTYECYNLEDDPMEKKSLPVTRGEGLEMWKKSIEYLTNLNERTIPIAELTPVSLDNNQLNNLKSIGYMK